MTVLFQPGYWSQDKNDWCHVGGRGGGEPNYGLPHVTGYIAEVDTVATNCVFCGKMNP